MSNRPLVFLTGLTVGDYLLWQWSSSGNHEVIAVVAGLSLLPLVLATVWRLALAVGRFVAGSAFGPRAAARRPARRRASDAASRHGAGGRSLAEPSSATSPPAKSPRKIAA